MPSAAADIIPPAYPAPSPHGYNPYMFDCLLSFLVICTGDELLVSTPVNIASGCANPFIDLSKYFLPSLSNCHILSGRLIVYNLPVALVHIISFIVSFIFSFSPRRCNSLLLDFI